jgi:hypothetical protein
VFHDIKRAALRTILVSRAWLYHCGGVGFFYLG